MKCMKHAAEIITNGPEVPGVEEVEQGLLLVLARLGSWWGSQR